MNHTGWFLILNREEKALSTSEFVNELIRVKKWLDGAGSETWALWRSGALKIAEMLSCLVEVGPNSERQFAGDDFGKFL